MKAINISLKCDTVDNVACILLIGEGEEKGKQCTRSLFGSVVVAVTYRLIKKHRQKCVKIAYKLQDSSLPIFYANYMNVTSIIPSNMTDKAKDNE